METNARTQLNLDIDSTDCLPVEQYPRTISDSYPENWKPHDHWMVGVITDDGKKTHAVGDTGSDAWSWSNTDNWSSFRKARIAVNEPQMSGDFLVFVLDRDDDKPYTDEPDSCAYIDFDDAVVNGKVHPWALDVVRMARSYAAVSTSGDGVHIEVMGELPDDVTQIGGEGEPLPAHEDFPDASIEIYDGKRIDVMSGERIAATPTTATRQDDLLEALCDFFLEEDERTARAGSYDNHEFTYDADEIEQMEIGDIDAVRDAIELVDPTDIRLNSTQTERDGNRYSWDPSWYDSNSGTTLGYDAGEGIWIWRNGDKKLNALDVVALEEGYISTPGETITGKDYIDALDELRSRGATIPHLRPQFDDEDDHFDKVCEAAFERDTTRSMTVFSAAMKHVSPDDISLEEETAAEVKRLGDEWWLHKPTGKLVDTLQLVAYAEGLTESVTDRVSGRVQWIQLGHALRWRGADVPQYRQ